MTADFTPPTPQSAQIMEYQMPQPALLTGAVDLSIPIYTVRCGDYELPLYMQYHSNGIKVMDDPAPCGYGWALMPALRATRTILGRPDELYPFTDQFNPDPNVTAYKCMVSPYAYSTKYTERLDCQHDLISLALPDYTVTRVIDYSDGTPTFRGGCDDEHIVTSDINMDSIIVTDGKGIKYTFEGPCESQLTDGSKPYRTCWALRRIKLPGGNVIEIQWTLKQHQFCRRTYLGGYFFLDSFDAFEWADSQINLNEFCSDYYNEAAFQKVENPLLYLYIDNIIFPGGSVKFDYIFSAGENMLSKITVSNGSNTIENATFSYDSSCLRLSKITLDSEGSYSFGYHPGSTPRPAIHDQDWWGFYNDTNNQSLTPKMEIRRHEIVQQTEGFFSLIGEADRSVDTVAMMNNILTSITYPTGGRCDFEYEPHKFAPMRDESANNEILEKYNPYLSFGGGVRVKRIIAHGSNGNPARIVSYEYSPAKVRAVPSIATFVDVNHAVKGLYGVAGSSGMADYIRSVNIRPFSNYMRYDIGETPLWYETVRARYSEGCEVYRHKDIIPEQNRIYHEYGRRSHRHLYKVFSRGPQLVAKEIYATGNQGETLVEKDSLTYKPVYGQYTPAYYIERLYIHISSSSSSAPDFDDVYGISDTLYGNVQIQYDPYECWPYTIVPITERLTAKTHTEYTENGPISTTETYTYKPGTSLLASVSSTTSEGTVRNTAIEYADASRGGVQAQMVAAHVTGVPVRETTTCGEASVDYCADYIRAASGAFVPRQVTTTLGTGASLASPVITYNAAGRPVQSTDADGRSTAWLWGYGNLHPVWKVEGMTYASLCARDSRVAGSDGHAEELALCISDRPAWHYTFRPLAFLTGVTAPWGTVSQFSYGWRNQLCEAIRNGELTEYHDFTFQEGVERRNRLEEGVLYDDERIYVKTTDFDGYGRPTRSFDNLSDAVVTTSYDAMGRPARTSVPLAAGSEPDATDWDVKGFEASPRGVVEWAMRPGSEWAGAGRRSSVRRLTNTPEGEYQCFRFNVLASGISIAGIYGPGRLRVTESTDEDGHTVREYRTLDGRLVQSSEGRTGDWLHTRYAYDAYGRLRVVLPPEMGAFNGPFSAPAMQNKTYIYTYDDYGRCTSAKGPGCEPSLTRYSRAGRVIAEHTPGMAAGKWLMHHYDACGRQVLSAIATASEEQLSAIGNALPVASYDAAATGTYALSPPLPMDAGTPQKAVYYDSYDFLIAASGLPALAREVRPLGLPAGARDYVASASGLISALGYDADGFVAEEAAQTPFGTLHRSYTRDRQGTVLTATEEFTPQAGAKIRRVTANTYDAGGRITRRRITENGVSAETRYTYDMRGNVASETCANGVTRRYTYDIHNWPVATETDVPLHLTTGPWRPGPITPQYYGALRPDTGTISISPGLNVETYTERLLYAHGAVPRYTGCPSARVNIRGARYDYRYDAHDRLTHALFTPADGSDDDEDFSVSYRYDAMARPTDVERLGIVDVDADGMEIFGDLDALRYSYDEAGRVTAIENAPDGTDYYGRPGFPAAGSSYSWDTAGRMTADTGRDITDMAYDHRNLPTQIKFSNGSTQRNTYNADGALIQMALTHKSSGIGNLKRPTIRIYAADRVWENNKLQYSYFPGGYFDADGGVHYLHNDYQGSVVLATDSTGTIEQRNTYYPYGEPHRTPAGQPILYGGKEHDPVTGEYNYDARRLFAPMLMTTTPDPLAGGTPHLSPYVFCAANPIRYIDLTGMRFTATSMQYIGLFRTAIYQQLEDNFNLIMDQLALLTSHDATSVEKQGALNKIATAADKFNALRDTADELTTLENSEQIYHIHETSKYSDADFLRDGTAINPINGTVLIGIDGFRPSKNFYYFGGLAHELKHAYQFETGKLSFGIIDSKFSIYDLQDEYEAYNRGLLFGQPGNIDINNTYNYLMLEAKDISDITNRLLNNESYQDFAIRNMIVFRYNGTTYKGI